MKDESKAKWPENMKWCSPSTIILDDETEVVYLPSEDLSGNNSDIAEIINRHRFGQICALPEMVALLKRIKSMNEDVSGHIWFPQEILDTVESILRDIGEVE